MDDHLFSYSFQQKATHEGHLEQKKSEVIIQILIMYIGLY